MSLPLLALEHLELLELLLLLPLCLAFGGVGGLLFLPPVSSSSSSSSQESLTQDPPLSQELFHPPLSQELLHPLSQEFSNSHESSLCQESSSLSQESCVGWFCCRCSLWSFLMLEVVPFPFFLPALFLPSPFARCCLFFFHIQLGELVDNVLPGHHSSPCSKGWCSPCGTGVPNIPFAKGCCNPFSKVLFGREERIEKKTELETNKSCRTGNTPKAACRNQAQET